MKKLISLLLVAVMLATTVLSAVPVGAENSDASVETVNDNLTVEGTNGFGDLLAEDLLESQEESDEEYKEGYTVTDIVIEGNIATVTYDSLEAANLVVALYTEDMVQMIMSANTVVDPESTTATVTFEGEMPQYFMAAAYLMDTYDMSPLCPMYDTPLYTKDMQDLLNSTVNDYDEELVLNLDESEETNFAVYAEDTVVVEEVQGVNTVASVDDENLTYVIENADDTVKNLPVGTVFVYPYGENEMLIARVGEITVDGDTVTITGTDIEMEDVFSHVKIEGESYTPDMTVDTSTADEGVTYEGLVSDGPTARSLEGGSSIQAAKHFFDLDKEFEKDGTYFGASVTVEGSLGFQIEASIDYYISLERQYLEFKITPSVSAEIKVSGDISFKIPLGVLGFSPIPGVYIGFEPDFVLRGSGEVEGSVSYSATIGVGFYSETGIKNLSTSPSVNAEIKAEVTVFLGVDFNPKAKILSDKVASMELEALLGVELKSESSVSSDDESTPSPDFIHLCKDCLKIEVSVTGEVSGEIKLLNKWVVSATIVEFDIYIGEMYWSIDRNEFGIGECPYISYKTVINVYDIDKNPVVGEKVSIPEQDAKMTNQNGIVVFYLPSGKYCVTVITNLRTYTKQIDVMESVQKVAIYLNEEMNIPSDSLHDTSNELQDTESKENYGDIGTFTGLLDYRLEDNFSTVLIFWYGGHDTTLKIPSVIDGYPVLYINHNSLSGQFEHIIIPDGVKRIGNHVFDNSSLLTITIPKSVTYIGTQDAYNLNLTTIYYGGSKDEWDNISMGDNKDFLRNVNIIFNSSYEESKAAPASLDDDVTIMTGDINNGLDIMSVYPGEYRLEITPEYNLKTASFEGLAPLEDYVLLVLKDMGAEDTLSADNLLYIGQGTALEDGTLTFKYVPKSIVDVSYVIACGPSNKDLKDATITFPEMEADGELAAVEPTVVYDGVTLTEGVDYVIVGTVDYTTGGTYTCYIRGIYDYTGTVTCTYTVKSNFVPGDIDNDGKLTAMDSNLLKRIVAGATSAEGILAADVNGDGAVNAIDSNILRRTIAGQ